MNIAALRELWEKTTKGPWKCVRSDDGHEIRMGSAVRSPYEHPCHESFEYEHGLRPSDGDQYREASANARFIAAAHNEMGKLLDVVEAAKVRVERGHDDACSHCLNPKYACDCGHELLRAALAQDGRKS